MNKAIIVVIGIIVLVGGYFLINDKNLNNQNKQEIGEKVEDRGRDHVTDIFGVEYSSNPPSSGPHFPVWAKQGKYDRLISDGYFIHSMEHGYVIVWYNCDKLSQSFLPFYSEVLAHDEPTQTSSDSGKLLMHMKVEPTAVMSWITPETQPEVEMKLPMSFETGSCKDLVENLKPFLDVQERIIIAPRINMDSKLALTAWGRILKLDDIDKEKMESFIKTYHNKGPEQTVE